MNPDWTRWMTASVAKWFDGHKGNTLSFFMEGMNRNTKPEQDYIELRINGPFSNETTQANWTIYLDVDVLIVSAIDDRDLYKLQREIGTIQDAFDTIPVFKYGDDDTLFGCLQLWKEPINVNNYGQIRPEERLQQAIVSTRYKLITTG